MKNKPEQKMWKPEEMMMKKNKILAAALLAAVLISGCAGINSPSGTEREKEIKTADMTETSSQETSVSTDTAVTEVTKGGTDIEIDWLEKLTRILTEAQQGIEKEFSEKV